MNIGPIGGKCTKKTKKDNWQGTRVVLVVLSLAFTAGACFLARSLPFRTTFSPATLSSSADRLSPFWNDSDFTSSPETASPTPVYAYSVIPGGVSSAQQLQSALGRDPVAAAHYADFRVRSARVIHLARERKVHVSYRMGNHIYWTRKEVTLHAGETLLSDGTHLARTRCGNRVAEIPDGPTSPSEPPIAVINAPVFPHPPLITTDSVPGPPIWTDEPTPLLAFGGLPLPVGPNGGTPFWPIPPIVPCCATSGGSPSTGPQSNPPPGPPTATPEPSVLLHLILGLAGIVFFLKFRRP